MDHLSASPAENDDRSARAWEAGDERGYEAIVTRYAPMVYARCRRALGAVDADDASQAVFLVLARRRAQAATSPALAAWLLTVTDNVLRNARRDRERRRRAEASAPIPSPHAEEPVMHGLEEHLDDTLAQLPSAEREAVVLHYLAGHSLAEVAAHTRSGVSTVKDRLNRGLSRLRTQFAKRGIDLGVAPLAAALQPDALTDLPAQLAHRLLHLPHAGASASTAAASARAIRWSHQGLSLMTYVAIIGPPLLIVLSAIGCSLISAETSA